MTLRSLTETLWRAGHDLRDDLLALRLQAVEDRPAEQANKLVEDVGAGVEALAGWAEEVLDAAARAVLAADPCDLPALRRALGDCTAGVERMGGQLHEELSIVRLDELNAFALRGGPEARAWTRAIKQTLDGAHSSLWTAQAALTACWRELADRPETHLVRPPADRTRGA